jgi:uncharacterized Zn-binding protein involved in type VI secretion
MRSGILATLIALAIGGKSFAGPCDGDPIQTTIFPPVYDVYDKFRLAALQQNLSVAEAMLSLSRTDEPSVINQQRVSGLALFTAESRYVSDRLKAAILKAADDLNKKGLVRIVIPRDQLQTSIVEGAILVRTPLAVVFPADGAKVEISLGFWTTIAPHERGLKSQYLVCEFVIHQIAPLEGPQPDGSKSLDLSKPYYKKVEQAKNDFFSLLPETIIDIPPISIGASQVNQGDVKVSFKSQPTLALAGRAFLLSRKRVMVMGLPAGDVSLAVQKVDVLEEGQKRLVEVFGRTEDLLTGIPNFNDQAALVVARPALAAVVERAWRSLDPKFTMSKSDKYELPLTDVELIPANARCVSPCSALESCSGGVDCGVVLCRTVPNLACRAACPPALPLDPVSQEIRDRCVSKCEDLLECSGHNDGNQDCGSVVDQCKSTAMACISRWTSGQQFICEEVTRALLKLDYTRIAEIKGTAPYSIVAESDGTELTIDSQLRSGKMSIRLAAVAHLYPKFDLRYVQFGEYLLCVDGKFGGEFQLTASQQIVSAGAAFSWEASSEALKGNIAFGKVAFFAQTAEPPLEALIRQNPKLLQCGVTAPIVGLAMVSVPRITREGIASAIRHNSGSGNSQLVAAIIDGGFSYEVQPPAISVSLGSITVEVIGKPIALKPSLTDLSLMWRSGAVSRR